MSSIVDKLIRFGEELTEMKSSAYDLWTWLPSHREAKKHHGDYACEFTPPIQTVMIEASIYIGHGLNPSAEELAQNEFYQCPCGEDHNDPDTPGDEDVAP